MKKIGIVIILVFLLQIFDLSVYAIENEQIIIASGQCGETLEWKITEDGQLVISGYGRMSDFELASRVPWYSYRSSITNIIIGEGVESLGESAFIGCQNLKSITLPNEITNIPSHLFMGCTSLETISIPENITEIGRYSFYGCSSLSEIIFNDNSLSKIGEYAFAYSGIESIIIPDCAMVENDIFRNCKNLKNVTLPDNLNKISENMFSDSGLNYFVVPNTVIEIEDYAFSNCSDLEFIAIAPSVESIGEDAFDGCGKYIDLGNGMTQYVNKSFIIKGEKGSYVETFANNKSWKYTFEEHYNCLKSVTEPTCISEGTKTYECFFCKQISNEVIDKAEHSWSETYTVDRESTCTEKGEKSIHCLICDEKKENSEVELELKEHIWDEGEIIKNPTNTEKGIIQYKCINCDSTKQEEIDILKYSISGEIESFLNENDTINIRLINDDSLDVIYETSFVGNIVVYSINEVPSGSYTIYVEKNNHISKEYSITINDEDIIKNLAIYPLGDINEDGKVNITDVALINAHVKKTKLLTEEELSRADINGDGKVNITDVGLINAHVKKVKVLF